MHRITCSSCRTSNEFPDHPADTSLVCSQCGRVLEMPQPPGEKPARPAPSSATMTPTRSPATVREWFYVENRCKVGPVTLVELQALLTAGKLKAGDLVLKTGSGRWVPAGSVTGGWVPKPPTGSFPAPKVWHFIQDRTKHGPISLQEIRALLAAGKLKPGDMVLLEGTQKWAPAGSLPELAPSVAKVTGSPTPPVTSSPAPVPPAMPPVTPPPAVQAGSPKAPVTPLPAPLAGSTKTPRVTPQASPKTPVPPTPVVQPATLKLPIPPSPASAASPTIARAKETREIPRATGTNWFYARNRQKLGPVPLAELKALAGSGQLTAQDMIMLEGSGKWMVAGTHPYLFPPVPPQPPPPAVPGAGPGPAPPAVPAPREWYYVEQRKKTGPVSLAELKERVAAGELQATDLVLRDGDKQWVQASTIRELFPSSPAAAVSGHAAAPAPAAPSPALPAPAAPPPASPAPPPPAASSQSPPPAGSSPKPSPITSTSPPEMGPEEEAAANAITSEEGVPTGDRSEEAAMEESVLSEVASTEPTAPEIAGDRTPQELAFTPTTAASVAGKESAEWEDVDQILEKRRPRDRKVNGEHRAGPPYILILSVIFSMVVIGRSTAFLLQDARLALPFWGMEWVVGIMIAWLGHQLRSTWAVVVGFAGPVVAVACMGAISTLKQNPDEAMAWLRWIMLPYSVLVIGAAVMTVSDAGKAATAKKDKPVARKKRAKKSRG